MGTMAAEGWLELFPVKLLTFSEVGLPLDCNDRDVWRIAQERGWVLITDNRSMHGEDSLEQTIRGENSPNGLPVLTIGNVTRLDEKSYREQCITRMIEILMELDNYLGAGRIYIP